MIIPVNDLLYGKISGIFDDYCIHLFQTIFFMKKIITVIAIIFVAVACNKDKNSPSSSNSGSNSAPKAQFSYANNYAGEGCVFTNNSSNTVSYLWEFGDGATSRRENPTHTYTDPGVYTVKLTATASNGTTNDVATRSVVILDPCDRDNRAYVTINNSSSNPYMINVNGSDVGTVPGNSSIRYTVAVGTHSFTATQTTGFLLTPTVRSVTQTFEKCYSYTWDIP